MGLKRAMGGAGVVVLGLIAAAGSCGEDDDSVATTVSARGTVTGLPGRTAEGALVAVARYSDGTILAQAIAEADGSYDAEIDESLSDGELVVVMALDGAEPDKHLPLAALARVDGDELSGIGSSGGDLSAGTTALALMLMGTKTSELEDVAATVSDRVSAIDQSSEAAFVAGLSDAVAQYASELPDPTIPLDAQELQACLDASSRAVAGALTATNQGTFVEFFGKTVFSPFVIMSRFGAASVLNELHPSTVLDVTTATITETPVLACTMTRAADRILWMRFGNCMQHAYAGAALVAQKCVSAGVRQVSVVHGPSGLDGHAWTLVSSKPKSELDLARVYTFPVNAEGYYDPAGTWTVGIKQADNKLVKLSDDQLGSISFVDPWGGKAAGPYAGTYFATYPKGIVTAQQTNKEIKLDIPKASTCSKPAAPGAEAFVKAPCQACDALCAAPDVGAGGMGGGGGGGGGSGPDCSQPEALPNGSCGGSDLVCIGTVQPCTDPNGNGCCPADMCSYFGTCIQLTCPADSGRNYYCQCCCSAGQGGEGCPQIDGFYGVYDACTSARLCGCSATDPGPPTMTCGG